MTQRNLTFGIMLHGAGGHMNSWKHPAGPADASVNLDFVTGIAQKAEANGVAFAFVADGLYINEKSTCGMECRDFAARRLREELRRRASRS
jgi:alkanesulfonate monooxygenase SsuD/methylene tetrahydromethanopterin reductase-like flavin-dependent oxidoreductase (luciferase family)